MGRRGPKSVDYKLLSWWEFEFFKAFHRLREGTPLPAKPAPVAGLSKAELRVSIEQLKRMSAEEYLLTTRRVAAEFGESRKLGTPPTSMDRWWAEQERNTEIDSLRQLLNPRPLQAQLARKKIWTDLVRADSFSHLKKVCGRWARLPDIRTQGWTALPQHVIDNAGMFLAMKRNQRFPRSGYGDISRVEYLARGMAGIMCGKSPLTGIERLRNMKHCKGGPFWVIQHGEFTLPEKDQYCGCWRCSIERSQKLSELGHWYENGLKLFLRLARTVKVPDEWRSVKAKNLKSNL